MLFGRGKAPFPLEQAVEAFVTACWEGIMIGKLKRVGAAALVFIATCAVMTAQNAALKITVLYDNTAARQECRADWGFAALVEGTEKAILFDTGTKSDLFLQNVQAVKADLSRTGAVVISHAHGDHTGGLASALTRMPDVSTYLPASSPASLLETVTRAGGVPVSSTGPATVCRNVWLTGTLGDQIKEQSLVIGTPKGLVILVGCSHPGIVQILERAIEVGKPKIHAVLGGFHLLQHSDSAVAEIVTRFRRMGVEKVGASHCTGDKAIAAFRMAYGSDFIDLGAGRVVRFE
jgi:7,8-dihydropterin-6-yl-methyl-4-(beta-D-ribofuranosyl)aminobenzene 5'-phosphate synthase